MSIRGSNLSIFQYNKQCSPAGPDGLESRAWEERRRDNHSPANYNYKLSPLWSWLCCHPPLAAHRTGIVSLTLTTHTKHLTVSQSHSHSQHIPNISQSHSHSQHIPNISQSAHLRLWLASDRKHSKLKGQTITFDQDRTTRQRDQNILGKLVIDIYGGGNNWVIHSSSSC